MNPLLRTIFEPYPMGSYGSAHPTEWATDLLIRDPTTLARLYPPLVRHAMLHFKSHNVLRFLGRKEHGISSARSPPAPRTAPKASG